MGPTCGLPVIPLPSAGRWEAASLWPSQRPHTRACVQPGAPEASTSPSTRNGSQRSSGLRASALLPGEGSELPWMAGSVSVPPGPVPHRKAEDSPELGY